MTDDLEERQARRAAILQHSAELMQRTEEMLAEPRPVMTWEPPRQIRSHDVKRIENDLDTRLLALEARLSQRMDAIESNLASLQNGVDGLADEAGGALGEVERKLRKEVEGLRSEVLLLRTQKSTPQGRKAISRAPWKDIVDASATAN
jgi:hypothetical protein